MINRIKECHRYVYEIDLISPSSSCKEVKDGDINFMWFRGKYYIFTHGYFPYVKKTILPSLDDLIESRPIVLQTYYSPRNPGLKFFMSTAVLQKYRENDWSWTFIDPLLKKEDFININKWNEQNLCSTCGDLILDYEQRRYLVVLLKCGGDDSLVVGLQQLGFCVVSH